VPIRKRGEKWSVDVYFPNGKRHRETIGKKKDAEAEEKRLISEIVTGTWSVRDKDITFDVWLDEYFEHSEISKAESTHTNDKYRIEAHLKPYFENHILRNITPKMVDRYKAMRIRKRSPENKVSNNTINHELICLSHIFRIAVRWGYADQNPVSSVEKLKVAKRFPRYLSLEEIDRLLDACSRMYIYPIVMTAIHTGMRKSELLNLWWSDVDFENREISIQPKKDWHTKNYRSRKAYMTPALYETLSEHRRLHVRNGIKNDYVFTYKGKRIKNGIDTSLAKAVGKAGLKDKDQGNVTLHTLRHTLASQFAMSGIPLRDIQELMGHQNVETTLQYAHLSEEHLRKQVLRGPFSGLGHKLVTRT